MFSIIEMTNPIIDVPFNQIALKFNGELQKIF